VAIRRCTVISRPRSEKHASPSERTYIQAMAARYTGHFDAARKSDEDRAYATAMAKVAATYPDDLDAAALYAEALFLLLPRPGTFAIKDPNVARAGRGYLKFGCNKFRTCKTLP